MDLILQAQPLPGVKSQILTQRALIKALFTDQRFRKEDEEQPTNQPRIPETNFSSKEPKLINLQKFKEPKRSTKF